MKKIYKYKFLIFGLVVIVIYFLYTKPSQLNICKETVEIETMEIVLRSYKKSSNEKIDRIEKTLSIKDNKKIKEVLSYLQEISFRKKPYIPNQGAAARILSDTILLRFYYKQKNNTFPVDDFELREDGLISISQPSSYKLFAPYTIGHPGKKQEKILYKDFLNTLNRIFGNEFKVETMPF